MERNQEERDYLAEVLGSYHEEELPASLAARTLQQAARSGESALLRTLNPGWRRLSLAASIAAFAIGIMMSNQVFASSQTSETDYWNFGEEGLYSFVVEADNG